MDKETLIKCATEIKNYCENTSLCDDCIFFNNDLMMCSIRYRMPEDWELTHEMTLNEAIEQLKELQNNADVNLDNEKTKAIEFAIETLENIHML